MANNTEKKTKYFRVTATPKVNEFYIGAVDKDEAINAVIWNELDNLFWEFKALEITSKTYNDYKEGKFNGS